MIRGRCKEALKGVTVVRECDSPQELCQLVGTCDGQPDQKYDINQSSVKYIRKVCQRCDGYEGGVRSCGKV